MRPNKLQQEAIDYLEGPLLVLAGPGTGKTQLLSHKVAHILEETDASPGNILCLTYTENGASNMRDRLYSIIGRDASKIHIHTYHAFGSDILADYKNYATNFSRPLDNQIDEIMQYKIVKQIQEDLDSNDILRGDKVKDILETIEEAKSARLTPDDLEKIANDNLAVAKEMEPELSEILDRLNQKKSFRYQSGVEEVYRPLCEVFSKYVKKEPLAGRIVREANVYLLELDALIKSAGEQEKPSISPLSAWKNSNFEKDDQGNYRLSNVISNKKLLSLASIMREYNRRLEKEGYFDFADMIEEAIRILKTDAGFRATLSERYQYILLDEFQDTNPSQAELIYLLTDYESPSIMAVGDDDQAIFEFQGANASNFLDFQNHYNAKVITLKENYRSTPEILALSRKIADQLESSFAKSAGVDKTLVAKGNFDMGDARGGLPNIPQADAEDRFGKDSERQDPSSKLPHIARHEFISADAEYYWVAKEISELIKNGTPPSEIAIICPKHKYIAPLLPYLKSHDNISISYEKRDNVLKDDKIAMLLTLARFVFDLREGKADPSDRVLEILSFPFFEVSPLSAIKSAKEARDYTALDYFENAKDEKIQKIGELLAALVTKSFDAPLELFFDYLTGAAELGENLKSPFLDFYARKTGYDTFELYENLHVLRAALRTRAEQVERPKLEDLLELVDDYENAGFGLVNTSPYKDSESAVQIMTVHKSKGLEFKYVFLIAVDHNDWGKGRGNNNLLVLPPNLIEIRHTGTTDDEKLRVLFVALTRAKTDLIMTNSISDFAGKTPKRLEYLEEYEDEKHVLLSPFLEKPEIITHYADLEAAKKETDLRLSWISAYKKLTPELKPILLKRLENYQLTASDLTSFIDLYYGGPAEFYKSRILDAPGEPLGRNIVFGTLVHSAFEHVTTKGISDEEAIAEFRTAVEKESLSPEDKKYMRERGVLSLEQSLCEFRDILRDKQALAEVNLYHEHLSLDGVPLTGKIDHMHIDRENKAIELYDFKTSKYSSEGWNSSNSLYKYKLQLGVYKLLLNLSPTYSQYKVERGHILFVAPDGRSEVHNKVYQFNEKEEDELKKLIAAVYREIKTLDFVDDPELFLDKSSDYSVSDIRKFVQKLIDKNVSE